MKKVLFIHHAVGWGGAPISLLELIKSLDKDEFKVKVLLIRDSIVSERFKEEGIDCVVAKSVFYRKYYCYFTHSEADYIKWFQFFKFLMLFFSWVLSKYVFASLELKRMDYDIVHLNSSVLTDWLFPASNHGKVVIHIREPFRRGRCDVIGAFFKKEIKKYSDHIIAISEDNKMRLGIRNNISVIYNQTKFTVPIELPLGKYKGKSLLYVGGVSRIKGFYNLAEAIQYLDSDITVYCAGYYPLDFYSKRDWKESLKTMLRRFLFPRDFALRRIFKNSDNVIVLGVLNDISTQLDLVTCLVSPFSVEHFSRPVIEAFSRRKPVIATNVEGMDETVLHKENGLIVPKNDSARLADAMNYVCSTPQFAKSLGDTGYAMACEKYSDENSKKVMKVYRDLLR